MKKIIFALTILTLAAPALAEVRIWCEQVGDTNEVLVKFDARTEPNLVRAFGLNVEADNDANILDATGVSTDYYIYPGSIVIDAQGNVTDYGSAACSPSYPGTLPGPPDGNGVTLEMGSLYAPPGGATSPNSPDPCGTLASLILDKSCNLTISGNAARTGTGPGSGVVMESPDQVADVNCVPCQVDFAVGCTCFGDIADMFGNPPADTVWVDFGDLGYLIAQLAANGWSIQVSARPDLLCADIADMFGNPPADGTTIDFGDLGFMIAELAANTWAIPCSTGGIRQQ
jgi:hypothetical protein